VGSSRVNMGDGGWVWGRGIGDDEGRVRKAGEKDAVKEAFADAFLCV
jgi:hypothetical protein